MRKLLIIIGSILMFCQAEAQVNSRCPVCPPSLRGVPDGYALRDSSGYARWQSVAGFDTAAIGVDSLSNLFWGLNGNSGTDTATNYIGTSDATDLIIKSNATEMIRLSADGNYSFPFDPTQKSVTFGNGNSFFKFGEYYGLKLIAANNVDIASFQGLDADSIFTDFHSNGSFFGNTPEQAQIIYKKNNWQFGYFNSFDSNGEPFANLFYAKLGDTITRPRDVTRVLVSPSKAHIQILLDTNGRIATHNGLDVARNYVQMSFAKDEEAQATGWSWTLDSISGLTFWSSGSNKFSIDTNGSPTIPINAGAGKVLTSDANGVASWQSSTGTPILDSIAATGATISPAVNTTHVITSAGAITSATLSFPTGTTGDWIFVIFNKAVATLTNTGTGASLISLVAPLLGTSKLYVNIGGNWY